MPSAGPAQSPDTDRNRRKIGAPGHHLATIEHGLDRSTKTTSLPNRNPQSILLPIGCVRRNASHQSLFVLNGSPQFLGLDHTPSSPHWHLRF
jgi:hypothetical protein